MELEEIRRKTGSLSQLAGITRAALTEGKASGTELFAIRTGSGFAFTVLPGRGMDFGPASYAGVPLNYITKAGIVSPQFYDGRGMNWLYGFFGGMLTTCGLDNVGGPRTVQDKVIGERQLGLHGRISNTPAEQVSSFEGMENGEYVMRVSGLMRDGLLHCEAYRMRRTVETKLGRSGFTLTDEIENDSQYPQPVSLLYHINAGYPLLDECSRVIGRVNQVAPADAFAAKSADNWSRSEAPTLGIPERCYSLELTEAGDGRAHIAIVNEELSLGFALHFEKSQLPHFNLWKMTNEREYVFGLEPCTVLPCGERIEPQQLLPGEKKTVRLDFEVLTDAEQIENFIHNFG